MENLSIYLLSLLIPLTNKQISKLEEESISGLLDTVKEAKRLCDMFGIKMKLNTVVNRFNFQEDMNKGITELAPFRWKVFQVLELKGENDGKGSSLRDVRPFLIASDEFSQYLDRHKHQKCLVPENNSEMQNSYLILDENMCFLDCSSAGKIPSPSILKVGVKEALKKSGFDESMFIQRGGVYDWLREPDSCNITDAKLDW